MMTIRSFVKRWVKSVTFNVMVTKKAPSLLETSTRPYLGGMRRGLKRDANEKISN
jgi:hypothetical protein